MKRKKSILYQIEGVAFVAMLLFASAMDSASIAVPAIGCLLSGLVLLCVQNLQRGGRNVY